MSPAPIPNPPRPLSGEELSFIHRLAADHRDALVRRYSARTSHADAEDLAQEVFVRAVLHIDTLMAHPNPGGWLFRTALHVHLNSSRRTQRRRQLQQLLAGFAPTDTDHAGLEEEVIKNLYWEHVRGSLALLPHDLKEVMDLYLKGHARVEMSRALEISLSTLDRRIAKGKAALVAAVRGNPPETGGTDDVNG